MSYNRKEITMTPPLFCSECGAALTIETTFCPFCGQRVQASHTQLIGSVKEKQQSYASDTNTTASGQLKHGDFLAQRYFVLEVVGQGGSATVYKVKDCTERDTFAALKQVNLARLSAQESIEATDAYNREITLLSRLRHPNLPRIRDHFADRDHWYLVMDFIEGETLEIILQKSPHGSLPYKRVLDLGITLSNVLAYLHSQHPPIIFRDLKPGNIILTPTGRLFLIDFGIARRYQTGQLKDTIAFGSPGYAAPEQYGKSQTTERSDIYALGATLQTLLTGQEPLDILLYGRSTKVNWPDTLQSLIDHMLQQDPQKRPKTATQVKQLLLAIKESTWAHPRKLDG
jgi:serine/threonine protein kinase